MLTLNHKSMCYSLKSKWFGFLLEEKKNSQILTFFFGGSAYTVKTGSVEISQKF